MPFCTQREDTLARLAEHLGLDAEQLADEFNLYNSHAKAGADPFGKEHFNNAPIDLDGYFYVGKVTPVLHYTMGGLKVDTQARVISKDGEGMFLPQVTQHTRRQATHTPPTQHSDQGAVRRR